MVVVVVVDLVVDLMLVGVPIRLELFGSFGVAVVVAKDCLC